MADRHSRFAKRPKEDSAPAPVVEHATPLMRTFAAYSQQLDDVHDRRERIIKLSRDINNDSKKAIFGLHRAGVDIALVEESLQEVRKKIACLASELPGNLYWKFVRTFGQGLQEYVEAVAVLEFLKAGKLISKDELDSKTADIKFPPPLLKPTAAPQLAAAAAAEEEDSKASASGAGGAQPMDQEPTAPSFFISNDDYLLGIADISGELVRLAINGLTQGDRQLPARVYDFLRELHLGFTTVVTKGRDVDKKMDLLESSLKKMEKLCYDIKVRGSEYPESRLMRSDDGAPPPMADDE